MITVVAGTNRKGSNTLKVASLAMKHYQARGVEAQLPDLAKLPPGISRRNITAIRRRPFSRSRR